VAGRACAVLSSLTLSSLVLSSCGGAASSELTTAKQSITKAEQVKAKSFLAKSQAEIDKINADAAPLYRTAKANLDVAVQNTTSATIGEAYFLLGKVSKELNLPDSAMMAYKQADKLLGNEKKEDKQMRSEMGLALYEVWIANVNKAVESYNAALAEDNAAGKKAKLQNVVKYSQACLEAKPENIDIVYGLMAAAHLQMEDTTKAVAAYATYASLVKPVLDVFASKGVTYKEQRDDVVKKLGAPTEAKTLPMPDKANPKPDPTLYFDKYTNILAGKDVYLFYPKDKDKGAFLLNGFSMPPASWSQQEKERETSFDANPYGTLVYNAYTKKDWDKAIRYAKESLAFRPTDEQMSGFLPTLYTESGKTDMALAEFKAMTEKNPNDKNALAQYGSMLSGLEKYDEAIVQFEKSLKIDPQFDNALFNLGACYKNKAGIVQKEEQKKADDAEAARKKDKKAAAYVVDVNKYKPFLVKSAEYFEQYRKLPGKDRDAQAWNVVDQLLNTYDVLDDKEKYKKMAGEFIALEYANTNNPRYYEALGRVYGKLKDGKKVKESLDKADALRKGGAK
jgi:tetratricopeptide (TPR) repeat protein